MREGKGRNETRVGRRKSEKRDGRLEQGEGEEKGKA